MAPTCPASIAAAGGPSSTEIVPRSGSASPRIMSIVVDLPAPLGPSSATVSPASIATSMPRTASISP
jgi:hypothetical protein